MKQVNPRMNEKFGENLGEQKLENFNEGQITQLYQLFVEIKQFDPLSNNDNSTKK